MRDAMTKTYLQSDDIVPDTELRRVDDDVFRHGAIADRVAELLRVADAPTTVGVFGPWGTGKSSFLRLLSENLTTRSARNLKPWGRRSPAYQIVNYVAWKYGGEALRRDLIAVASRELHIRRVRYSAGLFESRQVVRVELGDLLHRAWSFARGVFYLAFVLSLLAGVAVAIYLSLRHLGLNLPSNTDLKADLKPHKAKLATGLAVLLAAVNLPNLIGVSVSRSSPSQDDEFTKSLRELVLEAQLPRFLRVLPNWEWLTRPFRLYFNRRVVFLVDELDRATSDDIVRTLSALQTLLTGARVSVVLAADRAILADALDSEIHQSGPTREWDSYRSSKDSFFDKIFQAQFSLPPLRHERVVKFSRDLVRDRKGVWAELDTSLDDVLYNLIPSHVDSPRRVKVLLNSFATSYRVAEARGLPVARLQRDIAQWVVFQLEFPDFAADCLVEPRLKEFVAADSTDSDSIDSPVRDRLAEKYRRTAQPDASATPAVWADWTRKEQLHAYLDQVSHLSPPPTELLYVEMAGSALGQFEVDIARALDDVGRRSPSASLEVLSQLDPPQKLAAIRFLADRSRAAYSIDLDRIVEVMSDLVLATSKNASVPTTSILEALRPYLSNNRLLPKSALLVYIRVGIASRDPQLTTQLLDRADGYDPPVEGAELVAALRDLPQSQCSSIEAVANRIATFVTSDLLMTLSQDEHASVGEHVLHAVQGPLLFARRVV